MHDTTRYKLILEGEIKPMSQVEVVVTGTIGSAVPPLVANPSSDVLSLQTGVPLPSTLLTTVSGGVPPYAYASDPNLGPIPNGLELNEDGNGNVSISGTPTDPAGTEINFGVIATDSSGTTTAAVKVQHKKIV